MASSMSTILRGKEGENVRECVWGVGDGEQVSELFSGTPVFWGQQDIGRGVPKASSSPSPHMSISGALPPDCTDHTAQGRLPVPSLWHQLVAGA